MGQRVSSGQSTNPNLLNSVDPRADPVRSSGQSTNPNLLNSQHDNHLIHRVIVVFLRERNNVFHQNNSY